MNRLVLFLAVAALGLSVAALLSSPSPPAGLAPAPAPPDAEAAAAADRLERAFRRMAESVDGLEARVSALEARGGVASAPPSPGNAAGAAPAGDPPAVNRDAEPVEEVLSRVRASRSAQREPRKRLALVEDLLARTLADDVHGDALFEKGMACRVLGKSAEAAAAFEEALRYHAPGSAAAGYTTYQLAWEKRELGDTRAALDRFSEVARNESVTDTIRVFARARIAEFSLETGDVGRARSEAERLLAEYGSVRAEWIVKEMDRCRKVLEELDR